MCLYFYKLFIRIFLIKGIEEVYKCLFFFIKDKQEIKCWAVFFLNFLQEVFLLELLISIFWCWLSIATLRIRACCHVDLGMTAWARTLVHIASKIWCFWPCTVTSLTRYVFASFRNTSFSCTFLNLAYHNFDIWGKCTTEVLYFLCTSRWPDDIGQCICKTACLYLVEKELFHTTHHNTNNTRPHYQTKTKFAW